MKHLVFLLIGAFVLGSCVQGEMHQDKEAITSKEVLNYEPTILSQDTTNLFIGEGDINSDTVLIINEGGPHNQLNFDWGGRTVWSALPEYFTYYRAHVHQATSYNKSIYHWKREFTHEMAELEVNHGTEMLARTIAYFKARNKRIIVVGTSWGAQVILHYIAKYGNQADRYLISAGRLNSAPQQVKYHLKGFNSKFAEDGKTIRFPDTTRTHVPTRGEYWHKLSKVKQFMKGAMGKHQFINELANTDLSNLTFGYATNDPQIGALTEEELNFLTSKNVPVFPSSQGHAGVDRELIARVTDGTIKL